MFTPLNLASRFFFYGFDTLKVRPFTIIELNRLNYARTSGKLRPYVEAIGACIDQDALSLLPSDFYQIAYWLRLNSYPSKPFRLEWTCRKELHVKQAKQTYAEFLNEYKSNNPDYVAGDDEQLDRQLAEEHEDVTKSLANSTPVESNSMEVDVLDQVDMQKIYDHIKSCEAKYGVLLTLPKMADLVEEAELLESEIIAVRNRMRGSTVDEIDEQLTEIINNSEDELLSELASHISTDYGVTLRKRMQWLLKEAKSRPDVLGYEFLDDVRTLSAMAKCGVVEQVAVVCRGCGESTTLNVELELSDFFPEN